MHFPSAASVLILATCLLGSLSMELGASDANQYLHKITGPEGSGQYGSMVCALPSGNVVVVDPLYDSPTYGTDVGAVYLYDAAGILISTLTGDSPVDGVGSGGVVVLDDGNFVVVSRNWHSSVGAVTWVSGTTGASGVLSAQNSVVGTNSGDGTYQSVLPLANGAYLICMPYWDSETKTNVGAVAWSNSAAPLVGKLSEANALVGSSENDLIGLQTIKILKNGNYVVVSPYWDNGEFTDAGAVTWGSGATGVRGVVSATNSLLGTSNGLRLGYEYGGITELPNGNYLVIAPSWQSNGASVGAITWGSGTTGVSGQVSAENSLVGASDGLRVANRGFTVLANGNYVVRSVNTQSDSHGMVTWCNGATGRTGVISAANSLMDATRSAAPGSGGIVPLTNGNYVVISHIWAQPLSPFPFPGAVTWCRGDVATVGNITAENSLINTADGITVTPLTNGNYVVRCPNVLGGAVTWGSGTSGVTGPVTEANSLVGTSTYNRYLNNLGYTTTTSTARSSINTGATLTLNKGSTTVNTLSSATNATAGTLTLNGGGTLDMGGITIGQPGSGNVILNPGWSALRGGVVALKNGNYVVRVPGHNGNRGAVVWGDGTRGVAGPVSEQNALMGRQPGDAIGSGGVVPLANGNYVVLSPGWAASSTALGAGALTWCSGAAPTLGTVTADNSLVGSLYGDSVGGYDLEPGGLVLTAGVIRIYEDPEASDKLVLGNGNFVMCQPNWGGGDGSKRGAVTWINGATGSAGVISETNALIGAGTTVSLTPLADGNYLVRMPSWSNGSLTNVGAIKWADSTQPLAGPVNSQTALVGSHVNDQIGTYYASGTYLRSQIVMLPTTNVLLPINFGPSLQVFKDGHYVVSAGWVENMQARRGMVIGPAGQGITGNFTDVLRLSFPEKNPYLLYPSSPPVGTIEINGYYISANVMKPRISQDDERHRWVMGAPGAGEVYIFPYDDVSKSEITVLHELEPLRDGAKTLLFSGGESPPSGPNRLVTSLTIRNDGTAPLSGLLVTQDGLNSADFLVSPLPSTLVAPGQWVNFDVTFVPKANGVRTATLHIASNDGDENTFEVNLQGEYTGTLPSGTVAIDSPANATLYARENEGFAFIPLVRTGGVVGNVSVNVTTTAGTATAGTDFVNLQDATFTMGDGVSQVNLPIVLLNPQGTPEPGEQFVVTISGASVTPGATSSVTVQIQDSASDSVQPALPTIASPVANAALNVASGGSITVSGRATDNMSVAAVKVWLNGTACTNVSLTNPNGPTTAYSLTVTPATGTNTLMVQSVDASGNLSPAATRTFKVLRPLLVNTDPLRGSVTPGYFPASFREIGSSYAISATARPGFIFTGWTLGGSDVASGGSAFTPQRLGVTESALGLGTLRFTFREGLVLTANFAPNPFTPVAGSYNGLIRYYVETGINPPPNSGTLEDVTPSPGDPAPVGDAPSPAPTVSENPMSEKTEGFFKATVMSSGAFTAKVTMEGLTHNLVGTFDSEGVAHFGTGRAAATSVLRAARYNLEISLRLNLAADRSNDSISGTITQQSVGSSRVLGTPLVSTVEAPRIFYNGLTPATTVPAAYLRSGNASGIYTAAMEMTTEPTAYPWGFGYATATLMRTGVMNFTGMLPDGTPWTASAGLSKNNELPLFAQLTKRNLRPGFVIGLVVLDSTMENCDFRSLAGYWQAPKAGSPANSGGLTLPLSSPLEVRTTPVHFMMLGAKYAPLPGQSVLPGLEDSPGRQAELAFEGGGIIPSPLIKVVKISPADAVTRVPASDGSFALVITRNTGIFNGFFTHPGNGAQPKYRGVILQKGAGAAGVGYFETSPGVGSTVPGSMLAPIITGGVVTLAPQEAAP